MKIKKYSKADETLLFDLLIDEEMSGVITMGKPVVISTLKHLNRA